MTAIAWLGRERGEGAVSISRRAPTSPPPPRWKKPRRLTPNCPLGYDPAEAPGLRKGQKEPPVVDTRLSFWANCSEPLEYAWGPPTSRRRSSACQTLAAALARDPGEARVRGGPQSPPDPIRGPVAEAPALAQGLEAATGEAATWGGHHPGGPPRLQRQVLPGGPPASAAFPGPAPLPRAALLRAPLARPRCLPKLSLAQPHG